jgi:hypothetical protein
MSDIDNIRARQVQQRAHRMSLLPTIVGGVVAFVVGAFVVFSWDKIPKDLTSLLPDSLGFSGKVERLGRPIVAPLLRVCVTKELVGAAAGRDTEPVKLLEDLENGTRAGRISAVISTSPQHAFVDLAVKWGAVADCIFQQEATPLCDPDNRALAVEAANTFMRQAEEVLAKPDNYAATNNEINALSQTKDRLLAELQKQFLAGILTAADFRPFAATEIRNLLSRTVAQKNACEAKK